MKLLRRILPCILCTLLILNGCGSDSGKAVDSEQFIVREIGSTVDASEVGNHSDEYLLWSAEKRNPFHSDSVEHVFTVEFEGKEYIGEYWYSCVEMYNIYQTDYYQAPDAWFSVNSASGELTGIGFYNIEMGDKGIDDCRDEAIRIASKYIDVDSYELITSSNEIVNKYLFKKYVNGVETCAKLSIEFSTKGDLILFSSMMVEELDQNLDSSPKSALDTSISNMFSIEGIQEIEKKLATIYSNIVYDYEIKNTILVVLEDGNMGAIYVIDVNIDHKNNNKEGEVASSSTRVSILLTEKD